MYYSINIEYLFLIAVGIHFDYHNVDISYIHGLMADFKKEYCGPYTTEVPAIMKLPEQRTYSLAESHLLEATKKIATQSEHRLEESYTISRQM